MTSSGQSDSDLLVVGPLKQRIVELFAAVLPQPRETDQRKKLTADEASALSVLIERVIRVNTQPIPRGLWTRACGWAGWQQ